MKKGKQNFKKILFLVSSLFILLCTILSCNSWMEDDGFYEDIENEVKYANASELQVFVRYAATKMGKTVPEGNTIFKKEIESTISATTETEYGFYRWAAFSTSFLEAGDKQHSDFVFDDAESYAEKYGVNELPDSVVHFEDRTNPTTKVTILEERNDVFLVPVVAKRPTVALTIPGNGSNGVVRNMTVRINFTKAMDVASFKNAEDVFDKITVNQGSQSITADGDIDVSSIDITDHFDTPTISTNGKMLTLKFTEDAIKEGFSAQSYVNVQISREVKDIYGYSMADDYTLSFQVGTGFDTLAPRISELSAGIKSDFITFKALYKDTGTKDNLGSFTTFTSNQGAPTTLNSDLNNDYYSADLMAQRVTDKVNIRVLAEDISGSGTEQSQMGVESDVSQIMIRAIRVFNMDGTYVAQEDGNTKPFKSIPYVAQTNTSELEGGYADLITAANANLPDNAKLNKSKGFLFTYEDFNDFEDGLIRIDIGAVDAVGNTGFGDGGAYSSEYGNGYVTLFVVKDTTPPILDTNRITSTSASSPYGYYNAQTFNTINVRDNGIYDAGAAAKLRSPHDDIKWIIKAGADTSWVSTYLPEDDSWKPITDDYPLGSIAKPSSDGPMAITYALMDDLGNISEGGQISSITYDNTAPAIGTLDWVNNSGTPCLNTTTDNTTGDTLLQIPFTEVTSGVRRLIVSVNGVSNAFASSSYYATLTDSPITVNTSDSAYSDTVKPFATMYISDSGNFYIKNINLPNTDGSYNINVAMVDSALNTSSTVSTTFSVDKTLPVVSGLELLNTKLSGSTNWINGKSGHTLSFKVKEEGSGINIIELSGVTLSSPEIKCNGNIISSSEYSVSGTTLTLNNYKNPKIQGADCIVKISGIELNANENDTNTVTVKTKDFANTGTYSNDDNYDVKWDSTPTKFADNTITIKNISSDSTEYTNTAHVKLTVDVPVESSGSGITTLVITDGATYNGTNTIPVSSTGSQSYEVDLTATDGTATLKIKTVDLVGNESEVSTASITLDTVVPAIGTMSWDVGSTGMQPGIFNGTKMDQALVIPFTEATAGVNKITIDVKMPSGTSYNQPLTTDLIVTDGANTLTQGTDYSISGKIITLTEPRTSGTLKISGIHVAGNAVEGTYTFEAKLTDAAGNEMSTPATLTANNDSTAPEITKLYVPGIVWVGNDYWISKEYAYEGTAHPVEIELTVKENNSGISKIEFDTTNNIEFKDVKVKLNDIPVVCTSNSTAKTITIDPENAINKNGTNESVTIKIEGVCVFTSDLSNSRTIKMKVYDVAGNVNQTSYGTIASDGDGIPVSNAETIRYANSSPSIQSVTLTDRSDTGHKAQVGFTNEQYVNLEIKLNSLLNTCPVYKITLDGATFDNTGENPIMVKSGSSSINVTSDQLIISNDKKSLAIKSGTSYEKMPKGNIDTITINNVKLDTATEGAHTVNVTVTNACQFTAFESFSITLDTTKPTWNTTNPLYSYYNSSCVSKIYPTPKASEKAYGPVIGSNQYFYTAFKDGSDTTESCYVAGDCTESNLLGFTTSGTTLSSGNSAIKLTAGSTEYSIVAVDKAGNVSDVKKCYVKAENSKESINVSELYNRITLVKPDASADIYRMDRHEDTTIKNADIKYQNSGDSWNIYAYKTVIKSTTNNYVIKVKMGSGLTASDKKIFGGSVTPTSDSFTNYNPTTTHSPVTAYTVTHYYRHWADSYAGLRTFEPRFPDETYSFNLQSYFNSAPSYGWSNSEYESTTPKCTWHEMSKRNVTNIDDQISSYVDENGDINIKIPTTGKIPPLTLLLKNGTGQLNYVYLTEISSGTDIVDAWNYVTTWEVDDKLGGAKVGADGSTGTRSIGMNPISSQSTSGNNTEKWGNVTYSWGNQASTTSWITPYDGDSITGRAVKNKVNNTTYYTNDVKMGLFIGSNPNGTNDAHESITFTVTGTRSDPATEAQIAAGEYTARAKLYCSKNPPTNAPNYSTIVNTSESNGQITPWCYVRTKANEDTIFFMDYPHPNYSALGWNPKEPYYIYYLVEDRVGNYEIETVVNSHSDTEMVKWLYDAEGPKVTLRGKTTSPADVTTNVSDLVPNNNGYKASYNASKYYTWWSTNPTGTYNDAQGKGTTRTVGGARERENAPFFDIDVTDDSGIRAFAYSNTYVADPKISTFNFYTSEQGEGKWFGGQGSPTKDTIIGTPWTNTTYNSAGKYKVLKADGTEDSSYSNVYTGAAVCSVLPLVENSPLIGEEIYLYVMDWVGNISCTKMGGYSWNKDKDPPIINTTQSEEFAEQYYINSKDGILEFAGKKVNGQTTAKVYLPSGCYTDSGTAIFGWSLEMNNVATVDTDENGSYIQLDLSKYGETPSLEKVYIYDSVGNCLENSYNVKIDSTAPTYDLHVRAHASSDAKTHNVYIKGQGYGTDLGSDVNKQLKGEDGKTKIYSNLVTSESAIQERSYYVYVSDPKICFIAKTDELASEDSEGNELKSSVKYEILKWNGTSWVTKESETGNRTMGSRNSFYFEPLYVSSPIITVDNTDSGYYCIALSDRAGNSNYAYVYAKQDNKAPTVEAICTNVNTINGINYYGPKGKVQYKITAEDSGIYEYGIATPYIQPTDTTTVTVDYDGDKGLAKTYIVHAISNTRVSKNVELSYGGYSKWTYIDTTPTCGNISQNQQYIYNPHYSLSNKIIQNVTVTRDSTSGYSSLTISKTNTSGNLTLSTVTATGISSFSFKPNDFILNNLHPSAWKVFEGTLSSQPTKPDFVSWSDKTISDTDPYTFVSSNWTNKVYYFYPIDMAGNVGNPIAFSFETPVTPNVSAETHTGIYKNTSTNVTYFNNSSELKIKVTNPNSSKAIKITGYSIFKKDASNTVTTLKAEQFNEQNYINITPNSNEIITVLLDETGFESLNSENLYVQVQTEFTASDEKSFGKFCFDNTPPAISLSSVLCNSQAAGCGYKDGNSVIYGNNTSTVQLTLSATETGSGLKGYALSENPAAWSTDPITISRGATGFESSYTIYAKDNLGNVGSQVITFTLDSTTPNPPAYSVKNESDLQYVYYDLSEEKLYISKDSIELRAISADTNVYTYKCNTQTSQSGEFTINAAGTYSFYVVNKVGNESDPSVLNIVKDTVAPATPTGTITFYKDSTEVTKGFEIDATNRKVRFNPNLVNKAVFTPSAQTDDAATSGDGVGSGIAGYSNSRTATDWDDTVTFDLSSSDNNTSKKVYVKDKVGNVCTSSLSYSFTADSTGPQPSGSIKTEPPYGSFKSGDTPEIKGIYVSASEVPTTFVYDDIVGNNYVSLIYTPGDNFTVSLTDSDCVGYAFTCGCDSSATTQPESFTSVTPENKIITVPMPECELPHYYIFLWLQDSIGNVSVYNLIQDNSGEKNWWLSTESSHNVKYSYVQSSGNLTITGLACIPLKSIMITGENIYNISTNSITFDFDIPKNYMTNKSYNKNISWSNNGSGSFTGTFGNPQLTGKGTIVINIGNSATNINVRINSENGSSGIVASPNVSSPINKFTKVFSTKVRSVFTPKTKKIDLISNTESKVIEKDTGVISQNNQPSLTKTASPKKNNKAKVRKANNSNKVLDSSVVKNTVIQKKNNVIPEDAKVLEVSPIEPSVNASVITSEVINNSGVETTVEKTDVIVSKHKQNSILVYSLIALVMCAVIAMVVIVNKIIIDKTK